MANSASLCWSVSRIVRDMKRVNMLPTVEGVVKHANTLTILGPVQDDTATYEAAKIVHLAAKDDMDAAYDAVTVPTCYQCGRGLAPGDTLHLDCCGLRHADCNAKCNGKPQPLPRQDGREFIGGGEVRVVR